MFTALADAVAGGDKELIFYGPGFKQSAPVGRAGLRPLGADKKKLGSLQGQGAAQFGKADVIAGHQADWSAANFD